MSGDTSEVVTENRRDPPELGLFIIWENARDLQDRILSDMRSRFELVSAYEVHWTPALVTRNFERFYSDLDVRGVYHVLNKGAGPFTAVTVLDPHPSFEDRMTSRGRRTVNARFLDAKLRYRAWTSGLEVHCGETSWETNRDLTMLLGIDAQSYLDTIEEHRDKEIARLERDLTGTQGWPSTAELFGTLNHAVLYAVMRDSESLPGVRSLQGRREIELMTDEYHALHTILNARPLLRAAPHGGKFRVSVGAGHIEVGIRSVGDQYYDPRWARELLASRALDSRGFYRLSDRDHFETLAYHAIVHEPTLGNEVKDVLSGIAARLGTDSWTRAVLDDPRKVKTLLDQLLQERGYSYVRPLDATVFYNSQFLRSRRPTVREKTAGLRKWFFAMGRRLTGPIIGGYLRARDRALLRAPWVRTVKRFVTSNPFARSE